MSRLFVVVMLFCVGVFYGQKVEKPKLIKDVRVMRSYIVDADSTQELKSINWKSIQDFFKSNKKSDSIIIGYKVKDNKLGKSKVIIKREVKVRGKSEDVKSLIKIIRETI